jgi:hypothetical protein
MPPPVFFEKSPQAIENKGQGLQKEGQETSRGGKLLKTWNLLPRPGRGRQGPRDTGVTARHEEGKGLEYTPVTTGSMRNVLRTGEILTLRDADDERSRSLRKHTRGCGGISEPNGDTVSRTLLEITASVTICQVRN